MLSLRQYPHQSVYTETNKCLPEAEASFAACSSGIQRTAAPDAADCGATTEEAGAFFAGAASGKETAAKTSAGRSTARRMGINARRPAFRRSYPWGRRPRADRPAGRP